MPLFPCKVGHLKKIHAKNCSAIIVQQQYLVLLGKNKIYKIQISLSTSRMEKMLLTEILQKLKLSRNIWIILQ